MPIHEYSCSRCKQDFEILKTSNRTGPSKTATCPRCDERTGQLRWSRTAVDTPRKSYNPAPPADC